MMRMLPAAWALLLFDVGIARGSVPDEPRAPMPEPLVFETATDIDSLQSGELEVDIVGSAQRRADDGSGWSTAVSLESRVTSRFGFEAELGAAGPFSSAEAAGWSGRLTTSFVVLHDVGRDLHLQLEASAGHDGSLLFDQPGDPALPYLAGIRWGVRWARFTLRGGLDSVFGGRAAHAPFLGDVETLVQWAAPELPSYAGLELGPDLARAAPFDVIPEIAFGFRFAFVPAHVGIALPVMLNTRGSITSTSTFLRIVFDLS
jgi:hypothetical protein